MESDPRVSRGTVYRFDRFTLDLVRGALLAAGGTEIALRPKAFSLLRQMVENSGRLIDRDEIMAAVWPGVVVTDDSVTQLVKEVRRALGEDAQRLLRTVPRRGFLFAAEVSRGGPPQPPPAPVEPEAGGAPAPRGGQLTSRHTPALPSLVVLPFANLSGDPGQDYFADGMTEELTIALSRLRWFFVVARGSAFAYKGRAVDVRQVGRDLGVRYVLEGSVRRAGGRVRVTCQLAEAEAGHEVWADRFDGDLADIFDLQDRVAEAVAGAIEPSMRGAEMERARRKPTGSLSAYDLYLRALSHFYALSAEGIDRALALLRSAVALDPDFAVAEALAAQCTNFREAQGRDAPGEVEEAVRLARKVVAVEPSDPAALSWAALVLGYCGLDTGAAHAAIARALAISPNSVEARVTGGWINCWLCRPEEALGHLDRAIRLSPLSLELARMYSGVALAHLVAGRYQAALEAAHRALRERPDWSEAHRFAVLALSLLGRREEAVAAARRFREISPGGARVQADRTRRLFSDPAFAEARIRALREAGLPE